MTPNRQLHQNRKQRRFIPRCLHPGELGRELPAWPRTGAIK